MNKRIVVFLFIIFTGFLNANSQVNEDIVIGSKHLIKSDVLSEDREYWISLPVSYNQENVQYKKYPILILLDGNIHFHSVSGIVNYRSSGNTDKREIPEMIIVGVLNVNRERDFTPDKIITKRVNKTGGGDAFLRFLENELIPKIEKDYRATSYRLLIGHSLGGLITTHAYLQESTPFNSFISIDPSFGTWDNNIMDAKLADLPKEVFKRPIYIATANWDKRNLKNYDRHIRFYESLNAKSEKELNAKHFYYKDKNHSTVPLIAIYDGLSFIFEGYNQSYRKVNEISELLNAYKVISNKNAFEFLPPEELVNRIGYRLLRQKTLEEKQNALEFFILNSQNYPNSFNAFDSLGEAQYQLGLKEEAINSYKKSLELNTENKNAKRMIEKIQNE